MDGQALKGVEARRGQCGPPALESRKDLSFGYHLSLQLGFLLSNQLSPCPGVIGLFQASLLEKKGLPTQP